MPDLLQPGTPGSRRGSVVGMSDHDGYIEMPDGERVSEAEVIELMRDTVRQAGQVYVPPSTDEHGDPLPRLRLDDPPATVDDPLLRVGYALLAQLQLSEGWKLVVFQVTAAADEIRTFVLVHGQDDASPESLYRFPDVVPGLAEACLALRRSTYEPDGRGAWYNAHMRLYPDGTIVPRYDFSLPPFGCWGPRETELVRRDQELYPRDPERLPAWHPSRY